MLRYLKGSRNLKVIYRRQHPADESTLSQLDPLGLTGYADSDMANDRDDRKSLSSYIFSLNGNTISWKSKKRAGKVATSTTEAELDVTSYAAKHLIWLQKGLLE